MNTRSRATLCAACLAVWAGSAHAADAASTTATAVTAGTTATTTAAASTSPSVTIIDTVVGEGPAIENGKTALVHYDLTLTNGARIDSSRDKIVPTPFSVAIGEGKSIKGFELGLMGMKPGGKRTIIIPPELGYGPTGRGKDIPPNATLRFEVEALSVK
jgi:peptidylprolyl isomerase